MGIDTRLKEYEDYLSQNTTCSYLTSKRYLNVVRRFLLVSKMEFTISSLNNWLSEQNKSKSCSYYKYALRHFLISIGKKSLVDQLSPNRVKARKKVFNFISKDTMEKVINSLPGTYKRIAFLQLKTGARISEILTLRAENIDYDINPSLIHIKVGIGKGKSKGNKEGLLYLSKKYEYLLRKWVPRPFGYIFLDKVSDKADDDILYRRLDTITRSFNEQLNKIGLWYGIENLSSHYLRHLYADYFLKAGGDPIYLKKALRHSKIDTTMRYVSIDDQMVQKVIHAMEE